jgi:hypothetical protein
MDKWDVPEWVFIPFGVVFGPILLTVAVGCGFLWSFSQYHKREK